MTGPLKPSPAVYPTHDIVDRHAPVLRESATIGQAINLMAAERRVGVAIVDHEGYYLGACTAQSLVTACIGVRVSALVDAGSAAVRDDAVAARRRTLRHLTALAVDWQDSEIAVMEHPVPVSDVARRLQRGAAMIVVLQPGTRKFLGTIEPSQLLAALVG